MYVDKVYTQFQFPLMPQALSNGTYLEFNYKSILLALTFDAVRRLIPDFALDEVKKGG